MPDILVLGDGLLSDCVAARLARDHTVRRAESGEPPWLLVVAGDGWAAPGAHDRVRSLAADWHVPWLPLEVAGETVLIGPTVLSGTAGCDRCAGTRRVVARRETAAMDSLLAARGRSPHTPAALLCFCLPVVAETVAAEAGRLAGAREPAHTRAVHQLRLRDLALSRHVFVADPLCPHCGRLPEDSAERAVPDSSPDPKPAPGVYRTRDVRQLDTTLLETYVDREYGIVREIEKTTSAAYPYASAMMAIPGLIENGYGRAPDFQSCLTGAIAEALERLGGARPAGRRTAVRGSFRALDGDALDPKSFGLYSDEVYAQAAHPLCRYDDDAEIDWVWGYSYTRRRPVLVPECYIYYRRHHYDPPATHFVRETSNGCALGGTPAEAALHGLLELVERDSFLLTWYARLPARELDLESAADPLIPLMAERLEHVHGYRVRAFNITMEHGIPAVWVTAVHPGDDPLQAKAFCASGSGFDPERALIDAILEAAVVIPRQSRLFAEDRDRITAMLDQPHLVKDMEDHALLYCHPDAFRRLGFLLSSGSVPETIARSFAGALRPDGATVTEDLRTVVGRLGGAGLEVVAVDQTSLEHRVMGFSCAKVVVPGLLPLTFGDRYRRLRSLPRLLTVPHTLGFRPRRMSFGEVNPHPHPYP
ncbi:TOMM precursor leader peptide-binding protein [Nonomuraea typhae]|uniref:TOMM leader peptide-binding protein n=1 Tax=Nonomuraea typhae TaxID=2603600 RepID=A0ABW7YSR0_9ACTN